MQRHVEAKRVDGQLHGGVPEGFAHGFLAIENNTDVMYKTNNFYAPDSDGTLLWNDPFININWKLNNYKVSNPIISNKDQSAMTLNQLLKKNLSLVVFYCRDILQQFRLMNWRIRFLMSLTGYNLKKL